MQTLITNPCIRCGKQRIEAETWSEGVGNAKITHIDTVCPDQDCQTIVDQEIAMKKKIRDDATFKRAKDKEERVKLMAAKTS